MRVSSAASGLRAGHPGKPLPWVLEEGASHPSWELAGLPSQRVCFWVAGVSERREAILRISAASSLQPLLVSVFPGWSRVGQKV